MLDVLATLLFMEFLAIDTQVYLRELLHFEKRLNYGTFGSLVLSFVFADWILSKATGDTSNEVTYIFMISNPPNQNVINPPPESKSGPQSTSLANPRLPTTLANLGSLSEEMEEAFEKITKANQDTAIASLTTSHTQGANLSQAESPLIDPWLQGPPLSQESPSILDRVLQNSTPKRTRRGGDFDWRFSPMKEPLDFETVKRQWWGREPSTSGATSPLRRPNSEPEDQSKDMILAPSFGSAGSG